VKLRKVISGQFKSGGGGGMQTVGYSAAHTWGLRVGVGVATPGASIGVGVRVGVGVFVEFGRKIGAVAVGAMVGGGTI